MQIIKLIKILEHKVLLILTVSAFVFSISGYVTYLHKDQKERDAYFKQQAENREQGLPSFAGPYCFPDKHPQFLLLNIFLVGFLFLTLYFIKIYLLSFFLTIFLMIRFIYWYIDTQNLLHSNETASVETLSVFFYKANYFDFSTLVLLSLLFLWQISILFRMLNKKSYGKDILP